MRRESGIVTRPLPGANRMFPRRAPFTASLVTCMVALGLVTPYASATMYKCLVEDGKVFYQDTPCAPGRELRDFDKDPANVSVLPFDQPSPPKATAGKRAARSGESTPSRSSAPARVPKPQSKPARSTATHGDATQRKFLRPGMSEGEVMARVGPPDMTSSGGRKGVRWTYMPVAEDAHTMTNLQFDSGRLVEVERKVLQ